MALTWVFRAELEDGEIVAQTPEDVSRRGPAFGSAYSDIRDAVHEGRVSWFGLIHLGAGSARSIFVGLGAVTRVGVALGEISVRWSDRPAEVHPFPATVLGPCDPQRLRLQYWRENVHDGRTQQIGYVVGWEYASSGADLTYRQLIRVA